MVQVRKNGFLWLTNWKVIMIYLIDDNSTELTLTLLGLCWSTEPAQDTLHENNIVYSGGEDIPILITKDEQGKTCLCLGM